MNNDDFTIYSSKMTNDLFKILEVKFEETSEVERQIISAFAFGMINAYALAEKVEPPKVNGTMIGILINEFKYSEKQACEFAQTLINTSDFNGIYQELVELLGLEVTIKIYKCCKGQQVTFPMRIHSKSYVMRELCNKNTISASKYLARKLGYSERWIRELTKKAETMEIAILIARIILLILSGVSSEMAVNKIGKVSGVVISTLWSNLPNRFK